jgi:TonB family protein
MIQMPENLLPPPPVQLEVPVRAFADSDLMMAGVMEVAPDSTSQGPGDRGGAGRGNGPGIGPGDGPGLGPGRNRGLGDGVHGIGSGVRPPIPLHQEKPQYTLEAMRARIEGFVRVECIVQPDGWCTGGRIVRSLDQKYGLDQQALRAAALWRFAPGTLMGKPVPVLVTIQIGFSIH